MNTRLIKLISKVTLVSAVMILTSVVSVNAQSLAGRQRFTIPFDFVFGEKQLPAGKYSIGRAMPTSGDIILVMSDLEGRSKAIVMSHATVKLRSNDKAVLVFHRYGDQYFLAQVWPAGAVNGREFSKSKLEREAQKQQNLSIVRVPVDRPGE